MVRGKLLLGLGLTLLMVSATWSGLGTMSVQVRDGQLRTTPSFLATVIGSLAYGDRVDVQQQQGDWMEVTCKGQKGWVHSSALSTKSISMGGGGRDAQLKASGKEVALAGKGFNAEVEAQYRKGHQNANYPAVDQMELVQISPQEMTAFLDKGEVKPAPGGAQ